MGYSLRIQYSEHHYEDLDFVEVIALHQHEPFLQKYSHGGA
jgi:hypothetical protein